MEFGFLRGFPPTLRYLDGVCSWRFTLGSIVIDQEIDNDSEITLPDNSFIYTLNCVVEIEH